VFLGMMAIGVSGMSPDREELIAWGANYGPWTASGEWWRLLTAGFLHVGLFHAFVNMVILFDVGRIVERLYGNVAFLAIYLLAVFAGSTVSLAVHPELTSVGASAGVFGVFGALLVFMKRNQGVVPRHLVTRFTSGGVLFVVINVVYGALAPGIDNAAHVGGVAGGLLAGVCLVRTLPPRPERVMWRVVRAGALAAGLGGLALGVIVFVEPRVAPQGPRGAQLADIHEAVFRYQLELQAREQPRVRVYFLSVGGRDPTAEFVARFKGALRPVKPASAAKRDLYGGTVDEATDEGGMVLDIGSHRWVSDAWIEVEASHYEYGPTDRVRIYRVEWRGGRWVVTGDRRRFGRSR